MLIAFEVFILVLSPLLFFFFYNKKIDKENIILNNHIKNNKESSVDTDVNVHQDTDVNVHQKTVEIVNRIKKERSRSQTSNSNNDILIYGNLLIDDEDSPSRRINNDSGYTSSSCYSGSSYSSSDSGSSYSSSDSGSSSSSD